MGKLVFSLQKVGNIEINAIIHDSYLNRNKTGKVGIHFCLNDESFSRLSIYCLPKVIASHPVEFMNGTNINWFEAKQKSRQKIVDNWLLSVFNENCEVFKRDAFFAIKSFDEYIAYIQEYVAEVQIEDELQEDYDALMESILEYNQSTTEKGKNRAKTNIIIFFTGITAKIY